MQDRSVDELIKNQIGDLSRHHESAVTELIFLLLVQEETAR